MPQLKSQHSDVCYATVKCTEQEQLRRDQVLKWPIKLPPV